MKTLRKDRLVSRLIPFLFITVLLIIVPVVISAGHFQPKRHFLWSAQRGKSTVYLMGSIHLLKRKSYPLPRILENIYNCCNVVVFETDLDGMNSPELQTKIMKLGTYPAGQSIKKHISSSTYNMLEKALMKSGLKIRNFERFRPWFAALTLASVEIQKLGFDPALGVDRHFFNKSRRDGKQMEFLETNEFQIRLLANLGRRLQEAFLKETLKEIEVTESMASDMLEAWSIGDTARLAFIISISFSEHPEIYNRLFIQRNRSWASRIESLSRRKGDILVIVGSGHLVGRGSLIGLLEKRGYKIRQL